MTQKSSKKHYAWKIVLACILMKLGTGGAGYAATSNFVAPVTAELGCSVSSLTMFTSISAISMALLYTTAAKVLSIKRPGIVIGVASIVEVIGLALMSTYRTVQMFYISGAMIGCAQAFTGLVAIPILLNMWFKKDNGFVLGLVIAMGTVSSMIYNVLSAQLIIHVGWRMAYLIMAILAGVITVPAVFLFIKSPAEVGCEPYGAEEAARQALQEQKPGEATGLTMKQAFRLPLLYVAWLACVLYSYGSGVPYYVTPFATMELGQSVSFGAAVGVCSSIGTTLSSLAVGKINDKFGVKAGMLWGAVTNGLGLAMMFLSYRNVAFVFPATVVAGLGASMYTVQCPLLARSIVGDRDYSAIWARMMVINSLVGGGLNFTIGLFYDKLGTYRGAFIMGIAMFIAAGILGALAIDKSKKLPTQNAVQA